MNDGYIGVEVGRQRKDGRWMDGWIEMEIDRQY